MCVCVCVWTKRGIRIACLCNMQFHILCIISMIPSMAHRHSGFAWIMVTKEYKLQTSEASRQTHDFSEGS